MGNEFVKKLIDGEGKCLQLLPCMFSTTNNNQNFTFFKTPAAEKLKNFIYSNTCLWNLVEVVWVLSETEALESVVSPGSWHCRILCKIKHPKQFLATSVQILSIKDPD